jgi:hypothetical protein
MLIGSVQPGYLNGVTPMPAPHGLNTNGCVQCHMTQTTGSTGAPKLTGHSFNVAYSGCVAGDCHPDPDVATAFMTAVQLDTRARMQQVLNLLNQWATNKAPAITNSFAAYGRYAWEYATPGRISNPGGTNVIATPPADLQSRIPVRVQKARFNLYLVEHDSSQGVHNKEYTRFLLNDARTNVLNSLQ